MKLRTLSLWMALCLIALIGCEDDNRLKGTLHGSSTPISLSYDNFLKPGESTSITATGGFPPYVYAVQSGGGSTDGSGLYTASATLGKAQVTVTDSRGDSKTASIEVFTPGKLDKTFGPSSNGILTWTPNESGDEQGKDVVFDADGNMYVTSQVHMGATPSNDIFVAKYKPDGTLDSSFATGGTFRYNQDRPEVSRVIKLDNQDRIVIGGKCQMPGNGGDLCIIRLLSDGTLDSSFASGGVFTLATTGGVINEEVRALEFDSSGNILFAGFVEDSDINSVVGRLTSTGSLDLTFATTGYRVVDLSFASNSDKANGILLDASNDIYVIGEAYNNPTNKNDSYIWKLDSLGVNVGSFGTAGLQTYDIGNNENDQASYGLLHDGKLLVSGRAHNGTDFDFFLLAANPSTGALDNTFASSGKFVWDSGNGYDGFHGTRNILIDSSNRIVLGLEVHNGSSAIFGVMRLSTSGVLDGAFGTAGVSYLEANPGFDHALKSIHFNGDDRLVMVGWYDTATSSNDILIARTWYEH